MAIKEAATQFPEGVHFTLIEAIADHIIDRLFASDARFFSITVKIIKLAISEDGESIGITMTRHRK
jgi:dihydroneopterin aldolase